MYKEINPQKGDRIVSNFRTLIYIYLKKERGCMMSQEINNREYRQEILRDLIMQLHDGKTLEEVKPVFEKHFKHVSASEIAEMEQNLIMEGLPPEEIQRLCDVHAAVFKGSIEEIHQKRQSRTSPASSHFL